MTLTSHAQRQPDANITQRGYIPPACVKARVGLVVVRVGYVIAHIGSVRHFLDTNMLVSVTRKSRVWGHAQRESATQASSRSVGI